MARQPSSLLATGIFSSGSQYTLGDDVLTLADGDQLPDGGRLIYVQRDTRHSLAYVGGQWRLRLEADPSTALFYAPSEELCPTAVARGMIRRTDADVGDCTSSVTSQE